MKELVFCSWCAKTCKKCFLCPSKKAHSNEGESRLKPQTANRDVRKRGGENTGEIITWTKNSVLFTNKSHAEEKQFLLHKEAITSLSTVLLFLSLRSAAVIAYYHQVITGQVQFDHNSAAHHHHSAVLPDLKWARRPTLNMKSGGHNKYHLEQVD